jgi:glycosyltransferase involved in cell wall biosynthesis
VSPTKVLVVGAFDPATPRSRQWMRLLAHLGAEVEVHSTARWDQDRVEATASSPRSLAWNLLRGLWSGARRLATGPRPDIVLFLYPGHVDACVLGPIARLRGIPTVLDAFISLYDTIVLDREMRSRRSPYALALRMLDACACWSVRTVVVDTPQHGDFFARLSRRARARFEVLWVGADEARFGPSPDAGDGAPILWYLTFIPLHGIDTVLRAAALMGDDERTFRLIGSGQARASAEELARALDLRHVEFVEPVPEDALAEEIAKASVCLGAFGTTGKAERVVPNKVFQCAAAARPVVTAETPAVRAAFGDTLVAVPPGDPDALAGALRALRGAARVDAAQRARDAFVDRFTDDVLARDLGRILAGLAR